MRLVAIEQASRSLGNSVPSAPGGGMGCHACQSSPWEGQGVPSSELGYSPALGQASYVRARVVDNTGKPMPGVTVRIDTPVGNVTAVTDKDGNVVLTPPLVPYSPVGVVAMLPEGAAVIETKTQITPMVGEVVVFQSLQAAPKPIVDPEEAVLGGLGLLSLLSGIVFKVPGLAWAGGGAMAISGGHVLYRQLV